MGGGREPGEELFGVGPLNAPARHSGSVGVVDVDEEDDRAGGRGRMQATDVDCLLDAHDRHACAPAEVSQASQDGATLLFHAPSPRTLPQPEDDDSTVPADLQLPPPPLTAEQAALDAAMGREELQSPRLAPACPASGSGPDAKLPQGGEWE